MATINAQAPAKIRIANTGTTGIAFVPYRENFQVGLAAGKALEFEAKTSGQVIYYLDQATENLTVSVINEYTTSDVNTTIINSPAIVTLTNSGKNSIGFVPYKENFTSYIPTGDSVQISAQFVGQVLYYIAQATDGLTVTQEAVTTTPDAGSDDNNG